MKTIMADFILWRIWLYLLGTIGEPGHSDAMTLVDGLVAKLTDEAFADCEDSNAVAEQFRISRELAHWEESEFLNA